MSSSRWERESVHLNEALSTQDEARKKLLNQSASESKVYWVSSEQQTGGRGRQGRSWQSVPGDLMISCAFRFPSQAMRVSLVTLIAGLSLYECVQEKVFLKWPNDLFSNEARPRKIAGILSEGFAGNAVVVGWGVNIINTPRAIENARYEAASLNEIGIRIDRNELMSHLQNHFEKNLRNWFDFSSEFEAQLIQTLRNGPMASLWGRSGSLRATAEVGIAKDIDSDGALLIEKSGEKQLSRVLSGEFELNF